MKWHQLFNENQLPTQQDILNYINQGQSRWHELTFFIENRYQIQPQMSYSKCSAQPGWNVKYKKSGKSLCTLYPMEGYFIALIVIGKKEFEGMQLLIDYNKLSNQTVALFNKSLFSLGGHWLMLDVNDDYLVDDIKLLIQLRHHLKKYHQKQG